MLTKITLKNRIVIAFTIQTLIIALISFSALNIYVDFIEESLLYEHLSKYLDAYNEELSNGREPVVPSDLIIYKSDNPDLPAYISDLSVGGHEIVLDSGEAYHVFKKQFNEMGFILIKDQTAFEQIESSINEITIFVLILFIIVSFVFSKALANTIIRPVVDLANEVPKLTVDNYKSIKLDYPDDEIGGLVKVIYEHIVTLNLYLQREKWFTGDISHELRTPMMIITSSVDLLKLPTTTTEQKAQIYQRIENAIENVNGLINTFLLLARKKKDEKVEHEICHLSALSYRVIDDLQSSIGNKSIDFKVVSEANDMISTNPALFSIVLANLVKNAMTNLENGKINITLTQEGIVVKDSGKGLPEVVKQYINGNAIEKTKKNNNRIGLGLSIVKRICEREEWSISAYDAEEGGACFEIVFNSTT